MNRNQGPTQRRAFTLIELMVVLVIIGIVVAIVLPALGGARSSAKKAATLAMMSQLTTASGSFELDNRRQPGYFSPADMGDQTNINAGFPSMMNVMLDLSGGVTTVPSDGITVIRWGPNPTVPAKAVNIDIRQIGAPSGTGAAVTKAYFVPDPKYFVGQDPSQGQIATSQAAAWAVKVPSVIDSFGNPLLAWQPDSPTDPQDFAVEKIQDNKARYYIASNAAFLRAASLGLTKHNQNFTAAGTPFSTLGGGLTGDDYAQTMLSLAGNPAYATQVTSITMPKSRAAGAPRAGLIFHAAGVDGFYLGSQDPNGKGQITGNRIRFDGTGASDPAKSFDDIIVTSGN